MESGGQVRKKIDKYRRRKQLDAREEGGYTHEKKK